MVFLAEIYLPGGAVTAGALAARAQAGAGAVVAAAVGRGGTPARLLQVILLPEDEICFLLYRAESAAAVRAAGAAAGLDFDRVQDALLGPWPGRRRGAGPRGRAVFLKGGSAQRQDPPCAGAAHRNPSAGAPPAVRPARRAGSPRRRCARRWR